MHFASRILRTCPRIPHETHVTWRRDRKVEGQSLPLEPAGDECDDKTGQISIPVRHPSVRPSLNLQPGVGVALTSCVICSAPGARERQRAVLHQRRVGSNIEIEEGRVKRD